MNNALESGDFSLEISGTDHTGRSVSVWAGHSMEEAQAILNNPEIQYTYDDLELYEVK